MSLLVDHATTATIEQRRQELLRAAVEAKRPTGAAGSAGEPRTPFLAAGDRRRLQALFEAWAVALACARTESTDILAAWSPSPAPRRAFHWPERREVLDWGVWCSLVVLAVAHVIAST